MPWDFAGHVGVLSLWAACGLLPWFVALVARRGEGTFAALPFAIAGGIAGGLLTAAVLKDWTGLAVSIVAAVVAGALATGLVLRFRSRLLATAG